MKNNKVIKFLNLYKDYHSNYEGRIEVRQMDKKIAKLFLSLPLRQQKKYGNRCFTENSAYYFLRTKKDREQEKEKWRKEKKGVKGNLNDCLQLLNNIFTLNKNVKKNAYELETSDYCFQCGRHKDEDDGNCSESDYYSCRYENTTVDYGLRDSEYSIKKMLIITAIRMISENRLPIKFGCNEGIVYFEYCGKQISFHCEEVRCKKFDGVWNEIPNRKIPFPFII